MQQLCTCTISHGASLKPSFVLQKMTLDPCSHLGCSEVVANSAVVNCPMNNPGIFWGWKLMSFKRLSCAFCRSVGNLLIAIHASRIVSLMLRQWGSSRRQNYNAKSSFFASESRGISALQRGITSIVSQSTHHLLRWSCGCLPTKTDPLIYGCKVNVIQRGGKKAFITEATNRVSAFHLLQKQQTRSQPFILWHLKNME